MAGKKGPKKAAVTKVNTKKAAPKKVGKKKALSDEEDSYHPEDDFDPEMIQDIMTAVEKEKEKKRMVLVEEPNEVEPKKQKIDAGAEKTTEREYWTQSETSVLLHLINGCLPLASYNPDGKNSPNTYKGYQLIHFILKHKYLRLDSIRNSKLILSLLKE